MPKVFGIPFLIFLPIMLSLYKKEIEVLYLDLSTVIGSVIGFCVRLITLKEYNLWPISLVFWLGASIPAITVLNTICYLKKRRA